MAPVKSSRISPDLTLNEWKIGGAAVFGVVNTAKEKVSDKELATIADQIHGVYRHAFKGMTVIQPKLVQTELGSANTHQMLKEYQAYRALSPDTVKEFRQYVPGIDYVIVGRIDQNTVNHSTGSEQIRGEDEYDYQYIDVYYTQRKTTFVINIYSTFTGKEVYQAIIESEHKYASKEKPDSNSISEVFAEAAVEVLLGDDDDAPSYPDAPTTSAVVTPAISTSAKQLEKELGVSSYVIALQPIM